VAFGIDLGASTLWLLPDGYVVASGARFRHVGKSLAVNASTTNFREEEASPGDAELVGHTWRYVNKSGGPDRRFNDNRQIPIHRYGQLEITCDAWTMRLCLSRASAAHEFDVSLRAALNGDKQRIHEDRSQAPPKEPSPATGLSPALSVLGLAIGASMDQVSAAYKKLAAQNHPDKVVHMAVEFRELAERKMQELNPGSSLLR
jgi:hypothetical protein